MNMNKNKTNRYMPFIMAICVVLGIIIGTFFSNHFAGNRLNVINSGSNRLNNLLHLIDDQYVDAVNIDSLVDKAILRFLPNWILTLSISVRRMQLPPPTTSRVRSRA